MVHAGISDEDFCQPIFGANYLKGKVAPVPGRGIVAAAGAPFKLYFYHGGCTTFLKVFFDLMGKYKVADRAARSAFFSSQRAVQAFMADQHAYVDPSDPSVIFVSQPPAMEAGGRLPASAVPYAPVTFAPTPVAAPPPGAAPVMYGGVGPGAAPPSAGAGGGAHPPPGYAFPPPTAPGYAMGPAAAAPAAAYGAPPPTVQQRTGASGTLAAMQAAASGARFF